MDTPKKRQRFAWKLYTTYVAIGSPNELNLDILSRKVTDLAMITPHLSTFDAAQKRVYNLLQNDAYKRFLQWNVYLDLAGLGGFPVTLEQPRKNPPQHSGTNFSDHDETPC